VGSRVAMRLGVAAGAAALAALAALAVPVVQHSDWANTALRTAVAPSRPELAPLPATIDPLWHAAGLAPLGALPAGGAAVQGGTVVVAGAHRIEGRDPQSGAIRWSYERRNATLCDWTVRDGRVFTAFRKSHGCRDLMTLDAGTGARIWYRNAELDADITLSGMPSVLIAANAHALVAIDTGGGLNRWTYGKPGCTLSTPVPGDLGIGVLARCRGEQQLVVVDAFSGKERFAPVPVGTDARVLVTTQVVAVLSGGAGRPAVTLYDQAGRQTGAVTDGRLHYDDPARAGGGVYGGTLVGWTGRVIFGIPTASPRLAWTVDGAGPAGSDGGRVLARVTAGFAVLDPATGHVDTTARSLADGTPPSAVDRVGALVVTTGDGGTLVYG
jgi:hypothetical protein